MLKLNNIEQIKGKTFRHYKGGIYTCMDLAMHSEDGSILVIYKAHSDGTLWARPLEMFLEIVSHNESIVARFEPL